MFLTGSMVTKLEKDFIGEAGEIPRIVLLQQWVQLVWVEWVV